MALFMGHNFRYMVPLICQWACKPNSKAIFVWFLVDTGSPFTCLTVKTVETIFGPGNATHTLYLLAIQDQMSLVECQVSKGHFEHVNILGVDGMKKLKLSILVDWDRDRFKLTRQ